MHNTHGGPRPGAGRKPIGAARTVPITITLPPDLLAAASSRGVAAHAARQAGAGCTSTGNEQ